MNRFELEQLEPRILLSADGLAGAVLVGVDTLDEEAPAIHERATDGTIVDADLRFEPQDEDIFDGLEAVALEDVSSMDITESEVKDPSDSELRKGPSEEESDDSQAQAEAELPASEEAQTPVSVTAPALPEEGDVDVGSSQEINNVLIYGAYPDASGEEPFANGTLAVTS